MLSLTQEQQMLVGEWARIAEEEFEEEAFTWEGDFPWKNLELLAEKGFVGMNIPEAYGGGGMGEMEVLLQVEAIGRICPDTANALREMSLVGPRALAMFGTDEVKEQYLPQITSADSTVAIAISEPEAGSDVGSMNTKIEEAADGELYITGEKIWVSSVPESSAAVVWTRFPSCNLGTVLLDFDQPGVKIGEEYTNMSGAPQTHFFMEDVHIPKEHVLTSGPEGFHNQLKALNWERCGTAIGATTVAMCAFDKALKYAKGREQFGQPISEFQGIQWKLADLAKRIEASRTLTYRAVRNAQLNQQPPDRLETSIAKLYAAEMVEKVVSEALQIHGATGYQKEHPLEYLYRYARGRRIGGGTDEIQKNGIAEELLDRGLPTIN